jgi:acetyl-CoA synthetase
MLEKFLIREKFESYEDFKENYRVNIPENFNFAYDIIDSWALTNSNKTALVWCNDHNNEKIFSFSDLKRLSDKAANFFKSTGIFKSQVVMLMLKRRWQYWVCTLALQKIGAVSVPATVQ